MGWCLFRCACVYLPCQHSLTKDIMSRWLNTCMRTDAAAGDWCQLVACCDHSSAICVHKFNFVMTKFRGMMVAVAFSQAPLDKHTASLAQDAPVVCLFVNDTADAQVMIRV